MYLLWNFIKALSVFMFFCPAVLFWHFVAINIPSAIKRYTTLILLIFFNRKYLLFCFQKVTRLAKFSIALLILQENKAISIVTKVHIGRNNSQPSEFILLIDVSEFVSCMLYEIDVSEIYLVNKLDSTKLRRYCIIPACKCRISDRLLDSQVKF